MYDSFHTFFTITVTYLFDSTHKKALDKQYKCMFLLIFGVSHISCASSLRFIDVHDFLRLFGL